MLNQSPIIPWTAQMTYDPQFGKIDAQQLACQTDDVVAEDYFKGWKIAG